MTHGQNAPSRLYRFFEKLRQQGALENPTFVALGVALCLSHLDEIELRHEIGKRLGYIADQLRLSIKQMKSTSIEEETYIPYLNHALRWLATLSLEAPWRSFVGGINNELMLTLLWCSQVLPNEELPISDEEITTWIERIEKLVDDLLNSGLSDGTRDFLLKLLLELRDSVRNYQLLGLTGIEDALLRAESDTRRRASHLASEMNSASPADIDCVRQIDESLREVGRRVDSASMTTDTKGSSLPSNFSVFGHALLRS